MASEALDPIMRCSSCQSIQFSADVSKTGGCTHCGSRRMVNVLKMSGPEREKAMNRYPIWTMSQFEGMEEPIAGIEEPRTEHDGQ